MDPEATDPALPVAPALAERLAVCHDSPPGPPGGDPALREAAACFMRRRGAATTARDVLAAPGPGPLMFALLAAAGGDLVLPRPAAPWSGPPMRLLGRRARYVPTPVDCGGVPDPVALREAVARADRQNARPLALLLSVPDGLTGTIAPPELVYAVCDVAARADLLVICDESFRDTVYDPGAVVPGPADLIPDRTVAVRDLAAGPMPVGWPVALARFPAEGRAAVLRRPARSALRSGGAVLPGPVGGAAALALREPEWACERIAAARRLHGAVALAAHEQLLRLGAMCLRPAAGFHLYPDFTALADPLAAGGVRDARALAERLPGALPGQLFGDDPRALRVRIAVSALYGRDEAARECALWSADPPGGCEVADTLRGLGQALAELTSA